MDGELYDEFGNYIGPELESDESEEGEEDVQEEVEGVICCFICKKWLTIALYCVPLC